MHSHEQHEQLLNNLFQCLNAHQPDGMANCYHEQASFEDIAFRLKGKKQIHAMWDMICSDNEKGKSNIKVEIKELSVNDSSGHAIAVEDYTFRDESRGVHNRIVSKFEFRDGLIYKQIDECDPVCWAHQAFGGIKGFFAGHIKAIRRFKAMNKLKAARPQAFLS